MLIVKEILFIIIMKVFRLLNDEDEDIVEFIEELRRPYIVNEPMMLSMKWMMWNL